MQRLNELPLFTGLRAEAIETLTKNLTRKTFKRGETLLRQGEKKLEIYILVEGKVGVYAAERGGVGRKTAVLFHKAPYIVGEVEVWRERGNLGSVVAMERCETIRLTKKEFLKLLNSSHQVCLNMVQLLSNLLYKTAKDRRIRLYGEVDHLVANTICYFAQLYGEERPYGVLVQKQLNKSEIAEILGVARQSVIRGLQLLRSEGFIEVDGKQIVIPDLAALKKRAQLPVWRD